MAKKRIQGKIVSDKMDKTRVILVQRLKKHKKYGKFYSASMRIKAHDEKNEYHTGEEVEIEETRPMSREKNWKIIKKVNLKEN